MTPFNMYPEKGLMYKDR
uniref:Uncharacterized protein n=1 Tax=Arundo donax TaxID=35708 RepID=A0A0A9I0G4_ARUDO